MMMLRVLITLPCRLPLHRSCLCNERGGDSAFLCRAALVKAAIAAAEGGALDTAILAGEQDLNFFSYLTREQIQPSSDTIC